MVIEFLLFKNNVCEVFNGNEGDVFHELLEFMFACHNEGGEYIPT